MENKKIAIDLSMVDEKKAGIAYYAYSLAQSLTTTLPETTLYLFTNKKECIKDLKAKNVEIVEIKSSSINIVWHIKALIQMSLMKVDKIISPSNFFYGIYSSKTIQIVHDIAPVKFPNNFPKGAGKQYEKQLLACLKKGRIIATNSHTTAEDVITFYPKNKKNVHYIGTGMSSWMKPQKSDPSIEKTQAKYQITSDYILSLSTLQPRKNYARSIQAFSQYLQQHPESNLQYVIIGKKGWLYDELFSLVADLKLEKKVLFLGYVKEEYVRTLLTHAKAFVYVSVWEGFGIPLLEAYSFGIPIVASDIAVFHEVIKEHAIFVDPKALNEISKGIAAAISAEKTAIQKDFLDQYSWDNVAQNIIRLFK